MTRTNRATAHRASQTAAKQRGMQHKIAQSDQAASKESDDRAMQAGARSYPAPPFPEQHLPKSGRVSTFDKRLIDHEGIGFMLPEKASIYAKPNG